MSGFSRTRFRRALVAFVALTASCADATAPDNDLAAARDRWAHTAPASYEFTYRTTCFCAPDVTRARLIRVVSGSIASVRYADTGEAVPASGWAYVPTVDTLLADIARAVSSNAEHVDVQYDAYYGYPVSAAIDGSAHVADDEYSFTVSAFHPL